MNRRTRGHAGFPALVAGASLLAAAAGPLVPPPVAPDVSGAPLPSPVNDQTDTHTLGEPPDTISPELRRASVIEGQIEQQDRGRIVVRDDAGDRRTILVPDTALAPGLHSTDLREGANVRAAYEQRGSESVAVRVEPAP